MDADTNDITSNGLGNALTRDGQGIATANLPMGSFRHTGVGNALARSDYAAAGQVQDGSLNWAIGGGTGDAITVALAPALATLADGQLCFVRAPGANGTATPTFSPNGLTAHPITKTGGSSLLIGEIAGALAELILRYNLANTRWELLNPAAVIALPLGAMMPYTGSTVPNANFVFADGKTISRTTFASYFALVGTTYGAGDGVTTFAVPDMRGRGVFGLDNTSGSTAGRITVAGGNFDGTVLGATGGLQNHTLTTPEIPSHNHALTDPGHTHIDVAGTGTGGGNFLTRADSNGNVNYVSNSATTGITLTNTGGGGAHTILSPAIVMPWILRVL